MGSRDWERGVMELVEHFRLEMVGGYGCHKTYQPGLCDACDRIAQDCQERFRGLAERAYQEGRQAGIEEAARLAENESAGWDYANRIRGKLRRMLSPGGAKKEG